MTTPLAEHLQKIADEAPLVPVSPDTWAQARSARRRDGGLVALAASAVIAVVAIATLVLPSTSTSPQPEPAAPADGLRIDYVSGPGTDLLVGTQAPGAALAAYVNADGNVVLLDTSGTYHRLLLADRAGPVALSPDGTLLAYGAVSAGRGQLEVIDLDEGEVTMTQTRRLLTVEQLTWGQRGDVLLAVGRDATGATLVERLREGAEVTNGTEVAPVSDGARVVWTSNEVPVEVGADQVRMLRISRDARPIDTLRTPDEGPVVGACAHGLQATALRGSGATGWSAWSYDVRLGRLVEDRRSTPAAIDGLDLSVLGCLPGSDPLLADRLLVRSGDDLAVLTIGEAPSYDVVGQVDSQVPDLSVAIDLVP